MRRLLAISLFVVSLVCWGVMPALSITEVVDADEWVLHSDGAEDDRGEEKQGEQELDDETKKWTERWDETEAEEGNDRKHWSSKLMNSWESPFQKGLLEPPELNEIS
jgi:hypothetical protein